MLVLSRVVGEAIVINETTVVTVVEVRGGRVKIGIEAPPECRVVRSELLERDKAA